MPAKSLSPMPDAGRPASPAEALAALGSMAETFDAYARAAAAVRTVLEYATNLDAEIRAGESRREDLRKAIAEAEEQARVKTAVVADLEALRRETEDLRAQRDEVRASLARMRALLANLGT